MNLEVKENVSAKSRIMDSIFKQVFMDPGLFKQFVQDYYPYPLLDDIALDDIENMPTEYVLLQDENQHSDVIKRIRLPGDRMCFVIFITELQTTVHQNMAARIFIYVAHVMEQYIKDCEALDPGCSKRVDFELPLILPAVYYDGVDEWTAVTDVRDRFMKPSEAMSKAFPEMPSCEYWVMQLGKYSSEQILAHKNALALILHLDRVHSLREAHDIVQKMGVLPEIESSMTEYQRKMVAEATAWMLRKRNVPEHEIHEFVSILTQKEGTTAMFERLPMYDVQEIRREERLEGRKEGRNEGRQEGRKEGQVEMLKDLYLDDVISADIVRYRLAEFFTVEEISQFLETWDLERKKRKMQT